MKIGVKNILLSLSILLLFLNIIPISAQQNQTYTETRIEIKVVGELNGLQKAKVDELLNYFENQNPKLKIETKVKGEKPEIEERESKVGKYHFYPLAISALIIIFVLWLFMRIKKEKKYGINLSNNVFMLLLFLFLAFSGVLLIYGYNKIQAFDLKFWHVIVGLILLFAIIFHLIIHWSTWVSYFRKIFRIES